jgi:hypothetical protein
MCETLSLDARFDGQTLTLPTSVLAKVPGYTAHWKSGGSYVWLHKAKNRSLANG